MAKKSSSRKTLKSLFSKSDANLDKDVAADARAPGADAERSKFGFLKLRVKSKKSAEGRRARSDESSGPTEQEKAEHIASLKKSTSVYGTTPRSKNKEFSYSEMDLRKPKRFATFSFGLKRRKKRDEEDISKSSFGLGEPNESLVDLSHADLDQGGTKKLFSLSQPELDSLCTFDIPSPPPVAPNLSESYFPLPDRSSTLLGSRPPSEVMVSAHSSEKIARAPIASIPELQRDDSGMEGVVDTPNIVPIRADDPENHRSRQQLSQQPAEPSSQMANGHISMTTSDSVSSDVKFPHSEKSSKSIKHDVQLNPDQVYGALYETLFPKSFPSTETNPAAPLGVSALVQTLTPPSIISPDPPTDDTDGSLGNSTLTKPISVLGHSSPAHIDAPSIPELKVPAGAPAHRGAPTLPPPVSGRAASRGMGNQVTQSGTVHLRYPEQSWSPYDRSSASRTQMDAGDRPVSPAYLSVGSDEGSAAEIYYSAQEDNLEESNEDDTFMSQSRAGSELTNEGSHTTKERVREEVERGVGGVQRTESLLREEFPVETGEVFQRDEGRVMSAAAPVLQVSAAVECGNAPPTTETRRGRPGSRAGDLCEGEPALPLGQAEHLEHRGSLEDGDDTPTGQRGDTVPNNRPEGSLTAEDNNKEGSHTRVLPDTPAASIASDGKETSTQSAETRRQLPLSLQDAHTRPPTEPRPAGVRAYLDDRFPPAALHSVLPKEQEPADTMSLGLDLATERSPSSEWENYNPDCGEASVLDEATEDPGSQFRWKNRFYGATPYKPSQAEEPSSLLASVTHDDSDSEDYKRRSPEGEEPASPAGEEEERSDREAESPESRWDSQQPELGTGSSDDSHLFSGVFRATLVELVSEPAAPPASPDTDVCIQEDMDTLVDTLKSMGPPQKWGSPVVRPQLPAPSLVSSLPPIVEDVTPETPPKKPEENGLYTLPVELGLKWSSPRDNRPPLELMKSQEYQLPAQNGSGLSPTARSSRLDGSLLFSSYRPTETSAPRNRSGSLPDTRPSAIDRISLGPNDRSMMAGDAPGSRLDRLSFLRSGSSSLNGGHADSNGSRNGLGLSLGSPPFNGGPAQLFSPPYPFSPTSPLDLHRPFPGSDMPLSMVGQGPGALQRSLSYEGAPTSMFGGTQFRTQQPEPERNLTSKYRAFPDAYLTKEKEHGKLNPRPGKMFIFDRPGMCGQRIEVRGDVVDATPWELQETISIRVVRGGWVLYEKPNFKGEKIALDEGDTELTCPFGPPEETPHQNGFTKEEKADGEEEKTERKFIIGSVRRAVRDYSVPEISLFPEENAEGKKVTFRDTSEDARIFGFPIKAQSIVVNSGLWLVYAEPFFQGVPRILEVGGYPNAAAWGVEQPYVASVHPLKVGEPRVEDTTEPKLEIFEKPYFTGKSRIVTADLKNFLTRTDPQQTAFMGSVGSIKVKGGIWVGFQKEGFRGHQYLLEEGEYHDWRVWGGCDSELRSVRIIRADFTDPLMVLFEQPEGDDESGQENTIEVVEAIPDLEPFGYKTSTRSIHVLSGAWIAYSHVDFSGNQYVLEKGFYSTCADWGAQDSRICSIQPILPAASDRAADEIHLYSEPDFRGQCHTIEQNQDKLPDKFLTRSCRVVGASWVLYESQNFSGSSYVLSEGAYPNLTSMGCPSSCPIRSAKLVPVSFSVPSISLFSLESLEGREITLDTEFFSLVQEGFNSHVLSIRVNSGCWVICEHSGYRGRQFLLEPMEITNWPKFSSLNTVGSMYPLRQKRRFFRVRNVESGHLMSIQGEVEEMKPGRVMVVPEPEPMSDLWFYQDGLIKNKLWPDMCLQVMGNVEAAAKVVLWSETRQPTQTWTAGMKGLISSLTFPGMVLDIKGGRAYDKEHTVVMPENEERPSQQWMVELL